MEELVFVLRSGIKELVDDLIGSDAIALGGEIHNDAVTQHGLGERGNIFKRHMRPAVHECADCQR